MTEPKTRAILCIEGVGEIDRVIVGYSKPSITMAWRPPLLFSRLISETSLPAEDFSTIKQFVFKRWKLRPGFENNNDWLYRLEEIN